MAITNKGTKWEMKNSWFFIFLIFLPINFICYLIMNGRQPKRQYIVKAFLCIFTVLILFFSVSLSSDIVSALRKDYPDNKPQASDYLGYGYTDIENYEDTDEYKAYQKALDVYEDSEEYKEIENYNIDMRNTVNAITMVIIPNTVLVFLTLMSIICFFIDRPKYLRELCENENRSKVETLLTTNNSSKKSQSYYHEQFHNESLKSIDINGISEEDLATVPLLNIIDVKNIIHYRNENGGFSSEDEFFNCFNAKPHVIAKLSGLIIINSKSNSSANHQADNSGNRRFDI